MKVIMDDIIPQHNGRNKEEGDSQLRAVLQRAQDNNLRLTKFKCQIKQEEVKFHGHFFSQSMIWKLTHRKTAVVEMPRSANKPGV